jgi:predicted protein tyrosine phosphatase
MRIVVCPQRHLEAAFAFCGPADLLTLISPDAVEPDEQPSAGRRLTLRFNDIDAPRPGLVAPDVAMVERVLAFGAAAAVLVIHCHAGISRSTAAAYALACQATAPGEEAELARRLRALSPSATPNPLLVALADHRLERQGRMVAAIRSIGRGAEAFEGEPFDWRVAEPTDG